MLHPDPAAATTLQALLETTLLSPIRARQPPGSRNLISSWRGAPARCPVDLRESPVSLQALPSSVYIKTPVTPTTEAAAPTPRFADPLGRPTMNASDLIAEVRPAGRYAQLHLSREGTASAGR